MVSNMVLSDKRERASDCANTDKSQKALNNFSVYFEK